MKKSAKALAELDKARDAIRRAFSNSTLTFSKNGDYLLNHFVFDENVLYGDKVDEEDYIVTLSSPEILKGICHA
ncbi:MAG: hypothetical protein LBJ12_07245 [Oscillospiraceae bacterium]|nr:hypothetical protein [Oscillospiraceae bacterium]